MEPEALTMATQFGVAGLIAWMWLSERRALAGRERELSQAHERVLSQRVELESLVQLVKDNSRAVAALEASQRELIAALRPGGPRAERSHADRPVHCRDDAA